MSPLCVFYHCRLFGGDPPVSNHTVSVMNEQMRHMDKSGLTQSASEIHVGVNGEPSAWKSVIGIVPPKAQLHIWGDTFNSELPTMHYMQNWLIGHEDWYVCYFHLKGARNTTDTLNKRWRCCMESCVIQDWGRCVVDLDKGAEAVGAHWLTREKYGPQVERGFFGGNYWFAKASFLLTLPPLKQNRSCRADDFLAETWIGDGPRLPKVVDYRPHWPGLEECSKNPCI